MLKRNIAIFVAAGLLGAQAGLVAAAESAIPEGTDLVGARALPAQVKYFEQREATIRAEGVVLRGQSFPNALGVGVGGGTPPALTKYLNERAAAVQKEASGHVYNTVKIDTATKHVTVEHLSTVKIVNDKGQSFVWTADTLGEAAFPVKAVAPANFNAGDTMIYVRHPASHIPG